MYRYVCMYLFLYPVCMHALNYVNIQMYVFMNAYACAMHIFYVYIYMYYLFTYVFFTCLYECMLVCMYVYAYECMPTYIDSG